MSALKVSTEVVEITPAKAEKILKDYNYDRQRPINKRHVEFLAETMRRGEFEVDRLLLGKIPGGTPKLLDGQHRLSGIVLSGITQVMPLMTREMKDDREMARVYYKTDLNRNRVIRDAISADQTFAETGLKQAQINHVSAAVRVIEGGFQDDKLRNAVYETRSFDARIRDMNSWKTEVTTFYAAINGGDRTMKGLLERAHVMAVALITLRHDLTRAFDFWKKVASNDALRKNSPEGKLASYLMTHPVRNTREGSELARVVAYLWNAHVKGKDVQRITIRDVNESIKILNSPYA